MNNIKEIEEKIEKWLTEEKVFYKKIDEKQTHFHFEIKYGDNRPYHIFLPTDSERRIGIMGITSITQEHSETLQEQSDEFRFNLYWDLKFFFLDKANFEFKIKDDILTKYHLQKNIFSDGLTQDRLFSAIQDLHNTNLGGIWIIQRALGIKPEVIERPKPEDLRYIG